MRDRLQKELDRIFQATSNLANNNGDSYMRISHVVFATLAQPNIIAHIIIDELPTTIDQMMTELKANYERESDKRHQEGVPMIWSEIMKNIINNLMRTLPSGEILPVEQFFLALFDTDDPAIQILIKYKITKALLETRIKDTRMASNVNMHDEDEDGTYKPRQNSQSKTPFLDDFGRDLTAMAGKNELDPVYGRVDETERLAQVLARRKKNNPVLIGDPGIGKTAIVEKLAINIFNKECPRPLIGKRLVSLDLAAMVAGTKYRGQFEERVKMLIDEVRNNPNVIVFIDEIHMLVGAGNAAGSMDAANIFKPALARGELQCIGATTLDEYRESIEQDGALERRFQKIVVDEPSAETTLEIIKTLKPKYENYHKVVYTDPALLEIVRLSDRYISNRFFPDKAIDVLDEAGARCQIALTPPAILKRLETELLATQADMAETVRTQNYDRSMELREQEKNIIAQLETENNAWLRQVEAERKVITPDMVAKVVSIMTKIPMDKISQSERNLLKNVNETLTAHILGQDDAVNKVASSIKRNRLGLAKSNKPIGVFMFIGSTGVGKTYLAKMLAKYVFGSENNLIRFDMSEFSQPFNISRLIGSAPGYVGYEKGGQLTEKVRNNPYSVVLFDEIEKAHPDVYSTLLQLFDEGRLTDEMGHTVNFKNTIIIMTSNIGSQELRMFGQGIGYNSGKVTNEKARSIIEKAMKNKFKPEFLNRIDEIVQFNMLTEEDVKGIVTLQLEDLVRRAKLNGYTLNISPDVHPIIFKEGYDTDYGAREIQRTIQRLIENPVSDELLKEDIIENVVIDVTVEKEVTEGKGDTSGVTDVTQTIKIKLTPPYPK
jgi:ATP-dependent Clp protease ATP-binding subunit ClpC